MNHSKTKLIRVAYFYGMVWMEAQDGTFYFRRVARTETVAGLKDHYRKRGEIDAACQIFSTVKRYH